ncbi:hypothetical protein HS088_TW07G00906 [Tripterygium wilfordii]|uniref:F-box domain-containing protein n=1 Tax=Tripterygium wilfordii TaxID=458696 RepID=A0A7J7DG60_TRIWF|nr:F-box/FBD/LRR-repeat protein At1g13570-like [Tripterygium wilfordii]KAF5745322.1 hypothetical protein HS088_TW07G00906 [Tripterygium wilfordii]
MVLMSGNSNLHYRRKRMRASCLSASDIISDLPGNIIDNILTCLPIRDAVRTSILSRKWRFKWRDLSQLVFDYNFRKRSAGRASLSKSEIAFRIYQVLLLHRGSINKFDLSIPELDSCHQINHVINFLTAKNVQDFTLCVSDHDYYELPSTLFSCMHLRHLNLYSCMFKPPHAFQGLSNLISLELDDVYIIDANAFNNFISKCPQLQQLKLDNAADIGHLEIDAPNLKFFCFSGTFKPISFKNAPLLATVSIQCVDNGNVKYRKWKRRGNSNAVEVLGCLPAIKKLFVSCSFLKYLSVGNIPLRLPTTLNRLKSLELPEIYFNSIDDVRFALCLIKSSPNLKKLKIELFQSVDDNIDPILQLLEAQFCRGDYTFNRLRELRMECFRGAITELKFLELLLAKSLTLENIYIKPPFGTEPRKSLKILKEVTQLERASPRAKIMYVEFW